MKFKEWAENKAFRLLGGEVSGTEGAQASLRAAPVKEDGDYRSGRFGGPSMTFLDPGTLIRNVEFKGVGEKMDKVYHLDASFNDGKSWGRYEVYEKPLLKELDS